MKAHVFISVLAFHIVVIAGLYLLSACSSSSGPTPEQTKLSPSTGGSIYDRYAEPNRPSENSGLVVTQADQPSAYGGLDPAFNSGSGAYSSTPSNSASGRFKPTRPDDGTYVQPSRPVLNEFPEDEVLQPVSMDNLIQPVTPAVEYQVKKGDSLWKISKNFGIPLKELLVANGLTEKSTIQVGQKITIPSETSGPPEPVAAASVGQNEIYTVVKGDTLSRIAKLFNSRVSDIKAANGLSSDTIQLGQKLTIPVNSASSPSAALAPVQPAPIQTSTRINSPDTRRTPSGAIEGDIVHIVQPGETPGGIAKLYGITTTQLMSDNGIKDARSLRVDQQLQIRLGTAQPLTPPTSSRSEPKRPGEPLPTPNSFDDSIFDELNLENIPEVEVVPKS